MQCHMFVRPASDPMWGAATRCTEEATFELRHNGSVVSYRCESHTGRLNADKQMVPHDSQHTSVRIAD